MNKLSGLATAVAFLFVGASAVPAMAAITMTTGSGSAVSTVDAAANFESTNALFDNPYLEGGLAFSRTNLSFGNSGCGFAGCADHIGFAGFSGNYMYGTGGGGYFDIKTTGGDIFSGLEFVIGTGFSKSIQNVAWEAFLSNVSVGIGSALLSVGTIVGFSGAGGFDTLRYSEDSGGGFAPAFDTVVAQLNGGGGPGPIPEPATWALMISGFGMAGGMLRRRRAVAA